MRPDLDQIRVKLVLVGPSPLDVLGGRPHVIPERWATIVMPREAGNDGGFRVSARGRRRFSAIDVHIPESLDHCALMPVLVEIHGRKNGPWEGFSGPNVESAHAPEWLRTRPTLIFPALVGKP
jgi:hypothetical protein